MLSSLFFHHLDRDNKLSTLREIRRVLKPGAEVHIADWGKAANILMRTLFYGVQLLGSTYGVWLSLVLAG